jgi:hypothetical protein
VTTTQAINLLPVTRTRTPWRWGAAKEGKNVIAGVNNTANKLFAGVNDTADKVFHRRPPKSATAANIVIGTAMKSCFHKHPTHLDQRPLRPSKLNNAVLAASVVCEVLLSLFMAVPMTILAAVANFGGRRWKTLSAVSLTPTNSLLAVLLTPAITFFPGVVDTSHNIFHRCQRHRR